MCKSGRHRRRHHIKGAFHLKVSFSCCSFSNKFRRSKFALSFLAFNFLQYFPSSSSQTTLLQFYHPFCLLLIFRSSSIFFFFFKVRLSRKIRIYLSIFFLLFSFPQQKFCFCLKFSCIFSFVVAFFSSSISTFFFLLSLSHCL